MIEVKKKIIMLINQIDGNADLFYKNKIDEAYNEFINTISIIDECILAINKIEDKDISKTYINKISSILKEAMQAMEDKDTILLADILLYDLKEYLIEIQDSLL